MDNRSATGMIFDIQRFSTHDGPGVRTTIFFKGCPLSCSWCSNPESQSSKPQVLYFENLCTQCGACSDICMNNCVQIKYNTLTMHHEACTACGNCVTHCPHNARSLSGKNMSIDDVCQAVREDWRIYMQTNGGITCSGGEALAQPLFLRALLETLHDKMGFHTCLDTTAFAPWESLAPLLAVTDLFMVDIKHMDDAVHQKWTGVGNARILKNIEALAQAGAPTLIRLPLIPGFNDSDENIQQLANFLNRTGLHNVEVMPYHAFGRAKYAALGRDYSMPPVPKPRLEETVATLTQHHLQVEVHRQ